jgi:hypothetical protein
MTPWGRTRAGGYAAAAHEAVHEWVAPFDAASLAEVTLSGRPIP